VTGEVPPVEEAGERAEELHAMFGRFLEAVMGPTYSPTIIEASRKRNVIPNACEVTVDSRLLPGQTPADSEKIVRAVLGDAEYELDWIEAAGGTRSPVESPLRDAIDAWVEANDPGAGVAPMCLAGFTDSHWMREAFGTVAYGFFPMRTMDPEVASLLVHSADERIHVDDLELGLEFLRHAARAIGGAAG
jgi:acetylornithine deacetylase/succinyl-diaminopimelate desuccinylase-like protein